MNHKTLVARRYSAAAFLAVVIGFVPGSAQALPSAEIEISRAVAAAGASSIKQADPATFTQAFSSLMSRTKSKDVPAYVTAAVKLRPDLAPQITVAALRAHRADSNDHDVSDSKDHHVSDSKDHQVSDSKDHDVSCGWADPIIRAAIAAAPLAAHAIVREAIAADPSSRACILAAAGQSAETETAFLRPSGVDAGNINSSALGTINPANIGGRGGRNVVTPENP